MLETQFSTGCRVAASPIAKCGIVALLALEWMTTTSVAKPNVGSQACRQVTEAVLKGDAEAAVAAINQEPQHRDKTLEIMTRMADSLAGLFKGKTPRLERSLSDISVEGYPISLQIWSFGDQEVYLVGCLLRLEEGVQLNIQIRSSVDEVVQKIKTKLKSD
ncbi:hypothetical protein [Microvirga alba]|uniref:Uncharacterized protein n=1 Tax=Microvirga alba TaxID=2791025 RepID=A0A931BRR8_9HYPH|nr:hypothetical protein [Microvirga alba]MBF9233448.1 hypothetical protein [Microvirga alba]